MSGEPAGEVTPEQVQEAEATEDAQLTSAANDNVVPELTAEPPATEAADGETAQDAETAPMDITAADAGPEASQEAAEQPAVAETVGADTAGAETATTSAQEPAIANGQGNDSDSAAVPDFMKEPPHGAEVFVGGVPRGATEEQIKQYATKVGEVHSCSLVKEPGNTGQNRGYGFVKFMTKEAANRSMQELHQTEMPEYPNMKLRFQPSQSKNKLYLGNIPKDMMKDAIRAKLSEHVKGVVDVEVVMSKEQPGSGRGFCFVEFYNHSAAANAKTLLGSDNFQLGDRTLTVSYAEPKQSEMNQDQVKSVYVGNLPAGAKEDALREYFVELNMGEVQKVVIPNKKPDKDHPDYGFVHFVERSSAVKLVEECEASENPRQLEFPKESGNMLQIKMARPQVNPQQQNPGQAGGRGAYGSRGGHTGRGGRGGRGYDQGYGYGQYGAGYDAAGGYSGAAAGYGYDANGGYGYGGGYGGQFPAGMQMMPMMMTNGQVGYVMQPTGAAAAGAYGADRGYASGGRGRGGGGGYGNQRYRPY